MTQRDLPHPAVLRSMSRRRFIRAASTGTTLVALGGVQYALSDELTRTARAETRPGGRPRVPPGQRVLRRLKPMGGEPGSPNPSDFRLKVHGRVKHPFEVGFGELLGMGVVQRRVDVHCVTGWTVLGAEVEGVLVRTLAERAELLPGVRHVIFEGAHRYTANVPLAEALGDDVLVAHRLDGRPLARAHGAPARAIVPDLYFWKSAKWLTGIKFVTRDEPGYWEQRGYNNHGDPWLEERYA
jgi:DMSO/TMAO reductase YedYZ molybdopterin-dependent catalytic subunit